MQKWQTAPRCVIAVVAVAFAIVVGSRFKRVAPPVQRAVGAPIRRPSLETAGGDRLAHQRAREEVSVDYDNACCTYEDGIEQADRREGHHRAQRRPTFTMTGKEGRVGEKSRRSSSNGNVDVRSATDWSSAPSTRPIPKADGIVRAPGRVKFSRGRMSGSGVGLTYDKNQDILTILDQAVVHVAADAKGAGAHGRGGRRTGIRAARDSILRFERGDQGHARAPKSSRPIPAVAHLSADEDSSRRWNCAATRRSPPPGAAPAACRR